MSRHAGPLQPSFGANLAGLRTEQNPENDAPGFPLFPSELILSYNATEVPNRNTLDFLAKAMQVSAEKLGKYRAEASTSLNNNTFKSVDYCYSVENLPTFLARKN